MKLECRDGVGIFHIDSQYNNAYNLDSVREANEILDQAEQDGAVRALVVTASHKSMFSPGLDLPTLMGYSREEIHRFFLDIARLVRRKFIFPKAQVYALNGHAIAGGGLMPLAGEYRIMAEGSSRIGLVEIDLGIAMPRGSAAMVQYVLGTPLTETLLMEGRTYSPTEAMEMGFVDAVAEPGQLMDRAIAQARFFAEKPQPGYALLKQYLRGETAERMEALDDAGAAEMVEQWFSDETRQRVAAVVASLKNKK